MDQIKQNSEPNLNAQMRQLKAKAVDELLFLAGTAGEEKSSADADTWFDTAWTQAEDALRAGKPKEEVQAIFEGGMSTSISAGVSEDTAKEIVDLIERMNKQP